MGVGPWQERGTRIGLYSTANMLYRLWVTNMRTKKNSPRGRFVRRHPRKLPRRTGEFVVIGPYQEEVDRQCVKRKRCFDPILMRAAYLGRCEPC